MNLYLAVITIDTIVMFGANRIKYNDKCIQITVKSPVSVQVWGALSSRGLSLLRKLNGNMDSARYKSDIIHDIEMACECVLFPQKGCIFMHDPASYHNTKSTLKFTECEGLPFLDWPEISPDLNPIANVLNVMQKEIGNQMPCKKEDMWKQVCEAWYSVAPNVLEELYNSMPRRIADVIKAKECAMKYCFIRCWRTSLLMYFLYWNAVCCCVFIGMHFIFIYKCCLMIYRNKIA